MCKQIINTPADEVEKALEQKWKNATIANNFIFYKIMQNNEDVCKELLEILLQIKIDHIVMHTEETIEIDYDKKGIRLDVYAEGTDKAFDLEMQSTDKGELPERARYYQGVLDVSTLSSGADYKELKDNYVIFICVPDIFEKGLAKYTFENLCLENHEIKLNDRAYKYFFIASNYDKILDERQKAFLKLVMSPNATGTDSFTEKVTKLVEEAKLNTQWRKQFMEWEREMAKKFREGKEEGIKEGLIEGAQQKAEEIAKNALIAKLPIDQISQITGLSTEIILEINQKFNL